MSTKKLVVKNREKSELELLEFSDLEIEVEDDCSLVLKLANFGNSENLKITANLGRNSNFDVVFADFSDSNITVKSQVNLNQDGASCKWHLASLSGHENHKKFDISFTHHVGNTFALMDNYGVSREKSEIIFTGVNHILEGAKGSETAQNAKIIVFDPEARGTASPVLRIDENDVKASHGAVVGQLNEDHMFYLMSRGLSKEEARALITLGYLQPISRQFSEKTQERILNLIKEAM